VGFHMVFAWPIQKAGDHNLTWANAAFGETTAMLGILFLGAALAVSRGWSLAPVTIYAALAGAFAVLLGVRIMVLGLSNAPILTGVGFILTGLGGPLSLAAVLAPTMRAIRAFLAVALLAAAAIWILTAVLAYWGHLEMLSK